MIFHTMYNAFKRIGTGRVMLSRRRSGPDDDGETGQKPDNAARLIRLVASMAPVVLVAAFSRASRLQCSRPLITIVRRIARRPVVVRMRFRPLTRLPRVRQLVLAARTVIHHRAGDSRDIKSFRLRAARAK